MNHIDNNHISVGARLRDLKTTLVACALVCGVLLVSGCGQTEQERQQSPAVTATKLQSTSAAELGPASNPLRNAYFGDLHVHTSNSVDAYNMGVRASPDDAYRYAEGEAIQHPLGYPVRLRGGPLDFYAVTDHAEFLGVYRAMVDPNHPIATHPVAIKMQSEDPSERQAAFVAFGNAINSGQLLPGLDTGSMVRSTWQENIEAAERHNKPGQFTTFVAYEYSSTPGGVANLHRNVIFAGSKVPEAPFGSEESGNPEDLWQWLDTQRDRGMEALAIPHNSNWSQGLMFQRSNWAGEPIDAAYAAQRLRNEPLVEITQVKGTSETHPALSPNDEWADFEFWRLNKTTVAADGTITSEEGSTDASYVRDALRTGLELVDAVGGNPYQFGFIGSSDGHDAASPVEEDQYFGKLGVDDGSPEARGSVPPNLKTGQTAYSLDTLEWGASGLAGVWAERNTRDSLYAALRRREVFATSGPRIQLRFFAGYNYPETLAEAQDATALADAGGVPMGGELAAQADAAPVFFVWAMRDPREAWLQRAQIVKGWLADGKSHEQIFDVACSEDASPDPITHRCPDNGATVNPDDCSFSVDRGAAQLKTVWRDQTFDPAQRAFYYLRVLQNPSCRWSTWDAIRAGVAPNPKVPATIQERAWSSPIWYSPE